MKFLFVYIESNIVDFNKIKKYQRENLDTKERDTKAISSRKI